MTIAKKILIGCGGLLGILLVGLGIIYFISPFYSVAGVPVLNYHQVNDQYRTCLTMSTADFETQMDFLKKEGYNSISPTELYNYLENGAELPEKPILITFDDGYIDNYQQAYPIMKKYGYRGTIFIITGFVAPNGRYLDWPMIEEMSKNGFTFESHTVNHKPLRNVDAETLKRELIDSKATIEEHTGIPCDFIAYPEGSYNGTVLAETKATGYVGGFTVDTGRADRGDSLYTLERIPVFEGAHQLWHFRFRLRMTMVTDWLWGMRNYMRDQLHWDVAKKIPLP